MAGLGRSRLPVVLPAHPRTKSVLAEQAIEVPPSITVIEPLGYLDLAALASQAAAIATDSGGLQKEAYWYGVPCVTMRPSTEWVDTVEAGANVLVDDDPDRIAAALAGARMPAERPPLYGDGHASERIASARGSLDGWPRGGGSSSARGVPGPGAGEVRTATHAGLTATSGPAAAVPGGTMRRCAS